MEPYIGLIAQWPGTYAPKNWLFCAGQILTIQQNAALFALLGISYGGDGKVNFALPKLAGRTPMGTGTSPVTGVTTNLGATGGSPTTTLTTNNLPSHSHTGNFSGGFSVSLQANPQPGSHIQPQAGDVLSAVSNSSEGNPVIYGPPTTGTAVLGGVSATIGGNVTLGSTGASQAFSIMQPYLALNYIIAVQGFWPEHP